MKIIEFRIPMPMSVEDYSRCQVYAVIKGSKEEVDKGNGLHIVKNEPFTDGNFSGRITQKDLYLAAMLPNWLQNLIDPKFTILTEMSYNTYPITKTSYSNYALSSLVFSVESNHIDGLVNEANPLNLPEDILNSRKVVYLDIANDGKIPADENLTTISKKNVDFLPLPKDWIKKATNNEELPCQIMTCVKLVTVSVPYFGLLGSKVENFIMNTLKDQIINYHRRGIVQMVEWKDLNIDELRNMEAEFFEKINEQFEKTFGKHFLKPTVPLDTPDDHLSEIGDDEVNDVSVDINNSPDVLFPDSQTTDTYTGYLFKLGGVFFNATWNMRYIVLCKNMLYYYDGKDDNKPKDTLNLTGSKIQWVGEYYGRSFAFAINPVVHSPIYLSADTEESAKKWILILQLRSEASAEVEDVVHMERKVTTSPALEGDKKDSPNFLVKENGLTIFSSIHRAIIRLINVEKVRPSFQGVVSSGLNWYDRLIWFIFISMVNYMNISSKYFRYRYSIVFLIKPKIFFYYIILTLLCHISRLCKRFVTEILTPNKSTSFNLFAKPNDYIISMGSTTETFESLEKVLTDKTFSHVSKVNLVQLVLKDKIYNIIQKFVPPPITFKTLSHAFKLDSKTLFITTQIDNGNVKSFTKEDIEVLFNLSKSSQVDISELEFGAKRMDFDELIKNARTAVMDNSVFPSGNISCGCELLLIRASKRGCRVVIYSDFQPTTFPGFLFSKQFLIQRITPCLQSF